MKKPSHKVEEMRAEYRREDLGAMVRGKYAGKVKGAPHVVVLDPEVAKVFPDAAAVNAALKAVMEAAAAMKPLRTRRPPAAKAGRSR